MHLAVNAVLSEKWLLFLEKGKMNILNEIILCNIQPAREFSWTSSKAEWNRFGVKHKREIGEESF